MSYFHYKLNIELSKSLSPHSVNCAFLFIYLISSEPSDTDSSKCESSLCASLLDYPVHDLSTGETLIMSSLFIYITTVFFCFVLFFVILLIGQRMGCVLFVVICVLFFLLIDLRTGYTSMDNLPKYSGHLCDFHPRCLQLSICKKTADHQKHK